MDVERYVAVAARIAACRLHKHFRNRFKQSSDLVSRSLVYLSKQSLQRLVYNIPSHREPTFQILQHRLCVLFFYICALLRKIRIFFKHVFNRVRRNAVLCRKTSVCRFAVCIFRHNRLALLVRELHSSLSFFGHQKRQAVLTCLYVCSVFFSIFSIGEFLFHHSGVFVLSSAMTLGD